MTKSNSPSRDLISEADGVQYVRRHLERSGTGSGKLQMLDFHEERLRSEVGADDKRGRGRAAAKARFAGARSAVAHLEDMEVMVATIVKAQAIVDELEADLSKSSKRSDTPATPHEEPAIDSPAKAKLAATGPVNDSAKPSPGEAND